MISQLQNLRVFVANHLSDVVDWHKHVQVDGKANAEVATVLISTPYNKYKMTLGTSYAEPPAGAPVTCRSLGFIALDDFAANRHFLGPKSDLLYMEIAKHICGREITDALAAARREMAEAGPEKAGAARVRLAELADKAKKWGITAKVPEGPVAAVPPTPASQAVAPSSPAGPPETPVSADTTVTASSAGVPWIGCPVIYVTNPGEPIGGMREIPGHLVQIQPDGRISIFITPDNSEPIYRDNLHRRGSPAGNGRVHKSNCWDFNPEFERERRRVQHLEEAVGKMADESNRDRQAIAELRQAVADLTARQAPAESPEPASAKASERAKKATTAA